MQYNREKQVKIQTTWTRTEVAEMYGICPRTLDNWLKDANYVLRPHKAITFKQLHEIFALFGDPRVYVAAELEKLEQVRKKS